MRRGGFDVIIGNPPYVESAKGLKQYTFPNLTMAGTGNLFSVCTERFVQLAFTKGDIGVILPISAISTPRMSPLMKFLAMYVEPLYVSSFAVRPGKLFVGADMNLSIVIGRKSYQSSEDTHHIYSTLYNRWVWRVSPFLVLNNYTPQAHSDTICHRFRNGGRRTKYALLKNLLLSLALVIA